MSQFDDPNRQAVGLDPIWTDAENPPLPDADGDAGEGEPETKKSKKE